jgi:endonuclease I
MYSRCCALLVLSGIGCFAAPPAGYYDSAHDRTGQDLRQALHTIIRGHTVIPYSSAGFDTSDALKILDEDPANPNNVILLYARRSESKTNFPAVWNREHMWPNSYGLDDRHPAYSDLFNLRAEDENVNSSRGNKYYDTSETNHLSYRFPAHAEALLCSTDFDSWNPPDAVKGDIARAMFYMDVRYEGGIGSEPNLAVTEGVGRINSATNFMGRLGTLLLWHERDPVDNAERLRSERVFTLYQHNRNPFVDHPEWVHQIFWPQLAFAYLKPPTNTVLVAWSIDFTNAVLQSTTDLSSTWSDLTRGDWAGDTWRTFQEPSGERRFYRLRLW